MRQLRNGVGFCGLAAVLLLTGCHQSISGSYLASDEGSVSWLQLVRTPDNHLAGQIAASTLRPDGTIEQHAAPLTGAVDGENVTLSGTGFLGLQSFVLAGTINGNTLTITGAQSIAVKFKRSTMSEYQAQIAALNVRSQDIEKARAVAQARQKSFEAQKDFVAEADQLTGRMAQFDSQAEVHLGRFLYAEKGYEAITAKIAAYVARERQLAGNPNASVLRGQLSVAANQASLQTEQMHNQGVLLQSSFDGLVKPMAYKATTFEQQCHAVASNTARLIPAEVQSITTACGHLEGVVPTFRQKYAAVSGGLAHLEQVYQRERSKQEQLLLESQRLE